MGGPVYITLFSFLSFLSFFPIPVGNEPNQNIPQWTPNKFRSLFFGAIHPNTPPEILMPLKYSNTSSSDCTK
ncbi:hypothetical protein L873DRAFT_1823846 [Choiromyces venosus 120613-1]|uniref:Uncharacterized protein n=1 Tax=Choiromyces venosus 120613-1 TaxID=1336337 RepID=A0A3N4ISH3_9PEZI|nr:hypothetical protein L873DRAFT_1823846 [Choiromyces venosus 120613-1]